MKLFNFGLFLSEITSSLEGGNAVETPVSYTNVEIIFWYSALVVTLIITFIYLKSRGNKKKRINKISYKIGKEVERFENLKNAKAGLLKLKEQSGKSILVLSSFTTPFLELKEKTRVSDFDDLINKTTEIINDIKSLKDDDKHSEIDSLIIKLKNLGVMLDNVKKFIK